MRQKKRKTMEKETRHQRRHDSLLKNHCPRVNAILTERYSVKPNKLQTGLFHPLKVSPLNIFPFKIVEYETRDFKRKTEIKPIPILFILLNISYLILISYLLPRTITSVV